MVMDFSSFISVGASFLCFAIFAAIVVAGFKGNSKQHGKDKGGSSSSGGKE